MIFVGGVQFSADSSSSSSSQQSVILVTLLEHPILVSASHSFKSTKERRVSASEEVGLGMSKKRYVYLFQREYATVDPALVDFVGTDEATTCVGLVIRNRKNGMTSVAHMDSPKVVDIGVSQMLSQVLNHDFDAELDVHLVGGYEDISYNHASGSTGLEGPAKLDGHAFPLCAKIVETLQSRQEKFHILTLFVLGHNTKRDSQGNAYPIFNGLLVETCSGCLMPACFDRTSRCPDAIVRRLRVSASCEDTMWDGKLLETYNTQADQFIIAPCCWTKYLVMFALSLQHLSDEEFLLQYSTSPSAEGPDFVDNGRRMWDYLIKHPDWRETFPMRQPRMFERTADGGWKAVDQNSRVLVKNEANHV